MRSRIRENACAVQRKAINSRAGCLEQRAMNSPITHTTPAAPTSAQDESICFEAHGLLNQSYDSLDDLLHGLTHTDAAVPAEHAGAPEVTIVGQADALLPAHLFL